MTTLRRKALGIKQGLLLALAGCYLLQSCAKTEIDLGSDFVDNSTTNIVMVDSATLEITTNYVDSFITSGTGAVLVGNYKDPGFGNTTAHSFIQLGVPSGYSIPNGAVFDSLEVILTLNKTFYGDTLSPFSIAIHQLKEPIKLPNDQYSFYNRNKRDYDAVALGSKKLTIRPASTDTISIKISQALGQQLFDKMFRSEEALTNNSQFTDYFKGLAIVDGGGNNLVVGFKDSMMMRLHYRSPGVINTDVSVDFSINENSLQFNNITADRTGTPIATLGPVKKQIASSETAHAGFGQYISGAMVKISFPYLRNLLQLNDFVKIIRADLVIKPVKNSFPGYFTLPPFLRLSATDQYNNPGTDLSAYSSTTAANAIQYGNLHIDNLYGTETAYTYDITNYLQEQIAKTDNNKNGVLVLPPNPAQIFNRVIIGDSKHAESKSEVIIYYATVK